jgi:hypothetical protein
MGGVSGMDSSVWAAVGVYNGYLSINHGCGYSQLCIDHCCGIVSKVWVLLRRVSSVWTVVVV